MINTKSHLRHVLPRLLMVVAGSVVAEDAGAQIPDPCSYVDCALRIKSSKSLVQGIQEEHVATLFLWAPQISLFAERSDTAATLYSGYRSRHNSGLLMFVAGIATAATGLAVHNNNEGVGWALTAVGFGLSIGGAIQLNIGSDRLSMAIWWYNGTLAQP